MGAPAPESVKAIALALPRSAWRKVTWREGTKGKMSSRFARLRVQPAHRWQHGHPELPLLWLLIEWPEGANTPTKYWLSDLPEDTSMRALVRWAKSRWAVEMNYREMKDHLGLDHFEGRGWAGWHHHVTMVMLAFAFVLSERLRRGKGGQDSLFPRSWAGSSNFSPPGPASALSAASLSPAVRGMI
jgi:SRSO17 transposase